MARVVWGRQSPSGVPFEGESFDDEGKSTGRVSSSVGFLVLADKLGERFGGGTFHLEVYEKDRAPRRIDLPAVRLNVAWTDKNRFSQNFLAITAPREAAVESLKVYVRLPPGFTSANKLEFDSTRLKSGDTATFGPCGIESSQSLDQWRGRIFADVKVVIDGRTAAYKPEIWSNVEMPATPPDASSSPESRPQPPQPSNVTGSFALWHKGNPVVGSEQFPGYQQAVSIWSLEKNLWLLYERPAVLLTSADAGQKWTVVRRDLPYRPQGLTLLSADRLLLWGVKSTTTPEKGIAYVVEESKDGGKSWQDFRIPELDYLIGIGVEENVLVVAGVRTPKEGFPPGKDWFELPKVNLLSKDGAVFTEIVGPSLFDIGAIESKSVAPNGRYRAYVSNESFLDPAFSICLAKSPDGIPARVLFTSTQPALVWSENSKILALRTGDKFFAYLEVETGQSDTCDITSLGKKSEKEEETLAEFDKKVQAMISSNAK